MQDRFNFGCKDHRLSILTDGVVQWLDAKAIAGQQQTWPVFHCEGEHPAQMVDAIRAVFLVEMNDNLGIALAPKEMAACDQGSA